jgi:carbamoyltransferase-like protein
MLACVLFFPHLIACPILRLIELIPQLEHPRRKKSLPTAAIAVFLVNTSFNVRGEPIVCTPEDAFRCFMGIEIDMLVVGSAVRVDKTRR